MTAKTEKTEKTETTVQAPNPEFNIQRVYIKDISFESPSTPEIFKVEWKPELNLDINTDAKRLEGDLFDVTLKLTVKVKIGEKIPFLIEVKQSGIFLLKNFPEEQLHYMLGSFCPNILFPYARETISDLTTRGGFPPLYLAPINFDVLYQQHMEAQKKKDEEKK